MKAASSGLSIVEILIGIAIIGLLSSVGFASLSGPLETYRANQASRTYASTLKSIGDQARRQSRQITIDESELRQGNLVWKADNKELGRKSLPKGAVLANLKKQNDSEGIYFSGRGLPVQQITLTIQRNKKVRNVTLLPSGLVLSQ